MSSPVEGGDGFTQYPADESGRRDLPAPRQPRTAKHYTRREAGARIGAGVGGAALLAGFARDKLPGAVDSIVEFLTRPSSRINISPEQTQRLTNGEKSLCVFFGGASVESPEKLGFADALTGVLERFGAVGFANYIKTKVDARGLAEHIRHLHKQYGLEELNIITHSAGLQVFGHVAYLLQDLLVSGKLRFGHAVLTHPPKNISTTRFARAGDLFRELEAFGYTDSATFNDYSNNRAYGSPLKPGAAHSKLLWDEIRYLVNGDLYVSEFVEAARRNGTDVDFVWTLHPDRDPIVDPVLSESELRAAGLNHAKNYYVGGNQGHGNYKDNAAAYVETLDRIADDLGLPK